METVKIRVFSGRALPRLACLTTHATFVAENPGTNAHLRFAPRVTVDTMRFNQSTQGQRHLLRCQAHGQRTISGGATLHISLWLPRELTLAGCGGGVRRNPMQRIPSFVFLFGGRPFEC